MHLTIRPITTWNEVLNCARFTLRKEDLTTQPTARFIRDIIRSEHSPLRARIYELSLYDIPYYVSVHLCRHTQGVTHYVSTSRPDRTDSGLTDHDIPRDTPVNHRMIINAQAIINISRLRLCRKASQQTQLLWRMVVENLKAVDPLLAAACVPRCICSALCPEIQPCGHITTAAGAQARASYHDTLFT